MPGGAGWRLPVPVPVPGAGWDGGCLGTAGGVSETRIAVLDVDGTLVDSNYQHAMAWYRALRTLGEVHPVWRIHRLIGMGGDQLLPTLAGDEVEARIGDEARELQGKEVDALLGEIAPLPGARDLLVALKERGHRLVLASSGQQRHVDFALDLLDARDIADAWTSSADADATKPAPDLLQVALAKLGAPAHAPSVMVGDSVFDVEAAKNAGMPAIALLSGGFGMEELRDAGAIAVYETPAGLLEALDETLLA
jgi:HAD superfamily hydrolase (TIGR01549 family)